VASYYTYRALSLVIFFLISLAGFLPFLLTSSLRKRGALDLVFLSVIISISLSLLLSATLLSENLNGFDIHQEFSTFLGVAGTGFWHPEINFLYNSALSVTILPWIITNVTGLDGITIFKVVLPVSYSIVPVILYIIYRKVLGPQATFLSVLLFMSYPTFYVGMIQLGRQEVGEVLLVVLLWILLSPAISQRRSGSLAIVLLAFGVVIAHYSLAYICLAVLGFSFICSKISRRFMPLGTSGMIVVFMLIALSWYLFAAAGSALVSLIKTISSISQGVLTDFLNPAARPDVVLQALGIQSVHVGLLNDANRVTQWVAQLFLILGFLVFLRKGKRMNFTEKQVLPLMTVGMALIASATVLPFFAGSLQISRLYHIALLFVAPCFPIGAQGFESAIWRIPSLLHGLNSGLGRVRLFRSQGAFSAATLLFLYFMFTSGWVWAMSMQAPTSLILDRARMATSTDLSSQIAYYSYYTVPQDVASARWVRNFVPRQFSICADWTSKYQTLQSYGQLNAQNIMLPSECNFSDSFFYLSAQNTLTGIGLQPSRLATLSVWSVSSISTILVTKNVIYTDGSSEVDS